MQVKTKTAMFALLFACAFAFALCGVSAAYAAPQTKTVSARSASAATDAGTSDSSTAEQRVERRIRLAYDAFDEKCQLGEDSVPLKVFRKAFASVAQDSKYYYLNKNMQVRGYYTSQSNRCDDTFVVTSFLPSYLVAPSKLPQLCATFESSVKKILSGIDKSASDANKALAVHDALMERCSFDRRSDKNKEPWESHTAYGAIVKGSAVCQGYASAYQLLLSRLGVSCEYVSSDAMNHQWNMVKAGGSWYHVDVTWDDRANTPDMGHYYFMVSDGAMKQRGHYGWKASRRAPATYRSNKESRWTSVSVSKGSAVFDGKAKKPAVSVSFNGKKLRKGSDYRLEYSGNVNPGKARLTVRGMGRYAGHAKAAFVIKDDDSHKPASVSSVNVSSKSKGFAVSWKKKSGSSATYYQVRHASNAKMAGAKTAKASAKKLSVGKCKKGKYRYVQVRACKKVGSHKCYSPWSKKKRVRVS